MRTVYVLNDKYNSEQPKNTKIVDIKVKHNTKIIYLVKTHRIVNTLCVLIISVGILSLFRDTTSVKVLKTDTLISDNKTVRIPISNSKESKSTIQVEVINDEGTLICKSGLLNPGTSIGHLNSLIEMDEGRHNVTIKYTIDDEGNVKTVTRNSVLNIIE